MSFDAIREEVANWDDADLRKLQAFVMTLRQRREDPEFARKLAEKIDDKTPGKWLTLEEFDRRLGLSAEPTE